MTLVAAALVLAGCTAGTGAPTPATSPATASAGTVTGAPSPAGTAIPWVAPTTGDRFVVPLDVPAPSLAGNLLGDPADRWVVVTLPPSYFTSQERYPVVYFLEGVGTQAGQLAGDRASIAHQMQAAGAREFIVVEADGINSLGANFYANSPVGGNMADFLSQDLVGTVDASFRTIANRQARALAGFSMGGLGTVNLGLSRPDVFGSLYALSPPLLSPGTDLGVLGTDPGTGDAYAAAFAPDPTATAPPYAHVLDPTVPFSQQDPAVVAAYQRGLGDLPDKVAAYLAQPYRLSHVRVSYGLWDGYAFIGPGCDYLVALLEQNGIPHSLRTFGGPHAIDPGFVDSDFVSYFTQQFAGAS
ncbi:MAG TPA: alpha/beta hydrolase-fold protein [Cellulomonas sp.]